MRYHGEETDRPYKGNIETFVESNQEALMLQFESRITKSSQDILEEDRKFELVECFRDASMLAYIIDAEEHTNGPSAFAAYRGVVFGHMVLDAATANIHQAVTLEEQWRSMTGLSPGMVYGQLIDTSAEYLDHNPATEAFISCFMNELDPETGRELIVETAASLTLRQAEIEARYAYNLRPLRHQIEDWEKQPN